MASEAISSWLREGVPLSATWVARELCTTASDGVRELEAFLASARPETLLVHYLVCGVSAAPPAERVVTIVPASRLEGARCVLARVASARPRPPHPTPPPPARFQRRKLP